MSTRRRELAGRGIRRYREIIPPQWADKTPPVAGYTSWFDGDDMSSMTIVGGGSVSQWNDKGSGGNHATQSTVGFRPLVARHPTLFRGRTAVHFSEGGSAGSATFLSSSASASDNTQTSFVVAVVHDLASSNYLLGCSADGGFGFRVDPTTGALTSTKLDSADLGTQSNASVSVGVPFLAVSAISTNSVVQYLNGTSETDSHAQTFTAARTLQIGHSSTSASTLPGTHGWIAEIIIYDTTLNSTDIDTVSAWLRSKWDV